ncbi:MAG TPA: sulfatase-like hydrolase/transferase, partial [Brumimicrobium sp.]|nr:sulfatase-like hydrolase/transferase [Brumimicrobium sp.]
MIRKINNATIAAIISLLFCWSIGLFIVAKQHVLPVWNIWLFGTLNILFTAGIINLILLPWVYFSKNSKLPLLFLHLLFSFFILIEFISLFYFSITLKLIDQSLFQFSVEQAYLIFNAYFVFKWYYLLIPLPLLFYIFIYKTLKLKNEKWFYTTFLVFGVAHLVFHQQIQKNNAHFNHLSQNKTVHLLQSFLPKNNKFVSALSEEDIQFYQENVNPQLQNLTHPLYHKVDPSNPLSPFFNLKETPPNLVFIIVEGLSSSYSGPNADEISYTPFLDSLANHSLYFDNSLATSERSFAALPSIIGSLPHGKGAFNASYTDFPKNETLATWLFNNGYIGDFFFGGYSRFDNMDLFMKNQGFKNIYDHEEYNYEGTG